jgi:hypothetical protein
MEGRSPKRGIQAAEAKCTNRNELDPMVVFKHSTQPRLQKGVLSQPHRKTGEKQSQAAPNTQRERERRLCDRSQKSPIGERHDRKSLKLTLVR